MLHTDATTRRMKPSSVQICGVKNQRRKHVYRLPESIRAFGNIYHTLQSTCSEEGFTELDRKRLLKWR
jgi:hypothetical protein